MKTVSIATAIVIGIIGFGYIFTAFLMPIQHTWDSEEQFDVYLTSLDTECETDLDRYDETGSIVQFGLEQEHDLKVCRVVEEMPEDVDPSQVDEEDYPLYSEIEVEGISEFIETDDRLDRDILFVF